MAFTVLDVWGASGPGRMCGRILAAAKKTAPSHRQPARSSSSVGGLFTPGLEPANSPSRLLAIIAPAGFEQFFEEAVDSGGATTTEEYVAQAEALAEKYNMDIVGPPLEV